MRIKGRNPLQYEKTRESATSAVFQWHTLSSANEGSNVFLLSFSALFFRGPC